ncbi:MAG: outer membrane protein assembly factor BamD [Candidatus Omnitrophica bacterium]|nr:outer membrane protein assembly factor BamD [Candidatus Omnitrophota bacterium]
MKEMKKTLYSIAVLLCFSVFWASSAQAFWVWTPKSKKMVNPKYAAKDTPGEQFDWAMKFYKQNEFERAAEEFKRLVQYYGDSKLAPEAQYYAGRSYEELGKYYFAYQNYQKVIEDYPYTRRLEEIIEREYNIANVLETKEEPKLMDIELSMSVDRAIEIYRKIVENAPFGPYADKSLYKIAEAQRRMKRYDKAIEAYETIINDHPESSLVPEAKYQLAFTKYEASLDPEYDQESTKEAMEDFKEIAENTAVPGIAKEADKVLDELRSRKAQSTIKIAEFYERQRKYRGAIMYYKEVVNKFPGSDAAEYAGERITQLEKKIKK